MYKKIWGLEKLKKESFPCPPYIVIDITGDAPSDVGEYVIKKIRKVGIPKLENDRIGVTIRVSMPGVLDKLARFGGLHIVDERDVLKRVLEKYQQYGPRSKIVVQHTVDAKCSGTILKEDDTCIIEAIFGDAPPLLGGEVTDYEQWVLHLKARIWEKKRTYESEGKRVAILTSGALEVFEQYILSIPNCTYLEWSISKNRKLYFYEYYALKVAH
jgi:hypothetical protein